MACDIRYIPKPRRVNIKTLKDQQSVQFFLLLRHWEGTAQQKFLEPLITLLPKIMMRMLHRHLQLALSRIGEVQHWQLFLSHLLKRFVSGLVIAYRRLNLRLAKVSLKWYRWIYVTEAALAIQNDFLYHDYSLSQINRTPHSEMTIVRRLIMPTRVVRDENLDGFISLSYHNRRALPPKREQ